MTGVAFGFSSATGNDSYNGPAGPTAPDPFLTYLPLTTINAAALGDLGVKEAAFDFYTNSTLQIQNLDPSKKYNLTFFASHQYNDDKDTTNYTSYTDNTFATPVASTSLVIGGNGFWNQDQVATLSNLTPQTGNILYIGFKGACATEPGLFEFVFGGSRSRAEHDTAGGWLRRGIGHRTATTQVSFLRKNITSICNQYFDFQIG